MYAPTLEQISQGEVARRISPRDRVRQDSREIDLELSSRKAESERRPRPEGTVGDVANSGLISLEPGQLRTGAESWSVATRHACDEIHRQAHASLFRQLVDVRRERNTKVRANR